MTTIAPPSTALPRHGAPARAAPIEQLARQLCAAGRAAAALALDDPRWAIVGPVLTSAVDAARRAAGDRGSPIGAHEAVDPVLRMRDLARAGARLAGARATSVPADAVDEVAAAARRLEELTP